MNLASQVVRFYRLRIVLRVVPWSYTQSHPLANSPSWEAGLILRVAKVRRINCAAQDIFNFMEGEEGPASIVPPIGLLPVHAPARHFRSPRDIRLMRTSHVRSR